MMREPGSDDIRVGVPRPAPENDAALLRARLAESNRRREMVWLEGRIALLKRITAVGFPGQFQH